MKLSLQNKVVGGFLVMAVLIAVVGGMEYFYINKDGFVKSRF